MRLLLILTFLFSASIGLAQSKVLAVVGNKTITLDDFKKKFKEVTLQAAYNVPTEEQFLEDLIRFEVGLQEAKKQKLDKDPLVRQRFDQVLYAALLEKEVSPDSQKIKVTEPEMKNWLKKNPIIRVSHILVQHKPDASKQEKAQARKRADEILKEVKKSKRPFNELVALYSDDALSKRNGGDVGWHSRATLIPDFYNNAVKLKPNQISNLVKTPFGFHIVKLTGRRSYENADKRQVRSGVFQEKQKAIFDNYFKKVKSGYKIKVNKGLLK